MAKHIGIVACSAEGAALCYRTICLEAAAHMGAEVFITGNPSEPSVRLSEEAGITVIAAGHYATERFGVRALAAHLSQKFDLETEFHEVPNPV